MSLFDSFNEAMDLRNKYSNLADFKLREENRILMAEHEQEKLALQNMLNKIPVTTVDIKKDYDIICPVFFQLSNNLSSKPRYDKLMDYYSNEISQRKASGQLDDEKFSLWAIFESAGDIGANQQQYETVFYIGIQELRKKCALVGGNAIVGLRYDADLDTNLWNHFYIQMYGTAVKIMGNTSPSPSDVITPHVPENNNKRRRNS